ncbi:MAG: hypothetical protein ACYSUT_07095 [Planctomycetota bacterium]|jgi:hypothetical protein
MYSQKVISIIFFLLASLYALAVSDYAVEVIDSFGVFGPSPYDDPDAVLGKPSTQCLNNDPMAASDSFRVKLTEGVYNTGLEGDKLIATINPYEYIVVKFDHKVVDFPLNPYGQDLIVFGNAAFDIEGNQTISDQTNMNQVFMTNPATGIFEVVNVSVSQDGETWHSFENGPWVDTLYPTQGYHWDRDNAEWTGNEMDFTRPVDPNLGMEAFNGLSVADAIDLYDGSGGGTPFDLKDLADYDELAVDPNTGFRWIQYVRLEGGEGLYALGGEVDAVADVAVCGDPTHPYPAGDITKDCRVDLEDFAILSGSWLECTYQCD